MAAFIIYIVRWAVCLTLLYSLFGLLLKRETLHSMNRVVLLVILLASMVLPFVQLETKTPNYVTQGREMLESRILAEERIVKKEGDHWASDAEAEYARNISRITNTPVKIDHFLLGNGKWNWVQTLLLLIEIYVFGLFIAWLRYFWSLAMLTRLILQGKRVTIEGLPKHVRAITHPDIKTPCSWMRWMILNPADVSARPVIQHELSHIRLGHSWDMLLCEFTCRMLWFVPFAWMMRQDLRDVHEYQADRHVLSTGIKDEEYQQLLIRKATSTRLQPVVNALNHSPIKRRFIMMYRKPSRRWVILKAAYLLPLSAVALMAFATPKLNDTVEKMVEEYEAPVPKTVTEETAEPMEGNVESPAAKAEIPIPLQQAETTADEDATNLSDSVNYVNNVHLDEHRILYQSAEFPGGMEALKAYVQHHVKQTLQERKPVAGKQAYVQFHIRKDGTIDDIGLVSGDGEAYREAVKMVEQMPRWMPARDHIGRITDGYFVLTVNYNND